MRKFIVCLFALFVVGNATAETMCVKLSASKSCTYEPVENNQSNWNMTCRGVPVTGIAYCSNQSANFADKSESVTINSTPEENVSCWCKMVSPAVSSWVFDGDGSSAANCAQYCADDCAYNAAYDSFFRRALFSGLQ